jgi:hypothetical protein
MARIDVDQVQVLTSFVDALRLELHLTDRTCIVTLDPPGLASFIPAAESWMTVTPGEGVFVDGEQQAPNVTEEMSVTTTIYTRIRLDHAGNDDKLLLDGIRGLYPLKKNVLKAMIGRDLALPWKTDADAAPFLRALTRVVHCSAPQVAVSKNDSHLAIGFVTLTFMLQFDWDL